MIHACFPNARPFARRRRDDDTLGVKTRTKWVRFSFAANDGFLVSGFACIFARQDHKIRRPVVNQRRAVLRTKLDDLFVVTLIAYRTISHNFLLALLCWREF